MTSTTPITGTQVTKPLRILVVEDRTAYSYLILQMLTRHPGFRCEPAAVTSLAAALEHVERDRPDVVLLDLGLPDSFGFQTYAQVREAAPHTPIVLMTASDDDELAKRAVRQGAQDFLRKDDITPDVLVRSITYAVERAREKASIQGLSGALLRLQDEERRRIGRELHEVTNQKLAAILMELVVVERGLVEGDPAARRALDDCRAMIGSCAEGLRTMTCLLHAPLLDDLGLPGATRELADAFAERSGTLVDLEIAPNWPALGEDESLALYRVLQEALENVLKHSGSRTASIRLNVSAGSVSLEVEDAGCGFRQEQPGDDNDSPTAGIGILGMKERVRQLGGRLSIESTRDGTLVRATLPMRGNVS